MSGYRDRADDVCGSAESLLSLRRAEEKIEAVKIIGKYVDLASIKPHQLKASIDLEIEGNELTIRAGKSYARIRRYVDAEKFALALGLYRAEGQKKPRRVRFVNKDPTLHRWFIEPLREIGVQKFTAYAQYCYCKRCGQEKLREAVKRFEETTEIKIRKVYKHNIAHNPVFYTDVNNKALSVFIAVAEEVLRKSILHGSVPRKVAFRYLRGVFEGDGSLVTRIMDGKVQGMQLQVYESDSKALDDLLKIINKLLCINLIKYQDGKKEASIDIYDLLELLLNDVVPARSLLKIQERLQIALKRREAPWILMKLVKNFNGGWFTSREAASVLDKATHHTREMLRKLEKKGYLLSLKKKIKSTKGSIGTPIRRVFRISQKGRKLVKHLSSLLSSSKGEESDSFSSVNKAIHFSSFTYCPEWKRI